MSGKRLVGACTAAGAAFFALYGASAAAGSHLWRIAEIFSSADGRVQFIEFVEIGGSDNEFHLTGRWFQTNTTFYEFPTNLPGPTANLRFLIATQAFADLPGAPQPDYIIPEQFVTPAGDELVWFTYDVVTLGPGDLPVDGVLSLNRFTGALAPNSPTNFAGVTGSVVYADSDGDGIGDTGDNCTLAANADQRDTDGDGYGNVCDPDLNGDGTVNFVDLGDMKALFFGSDANADLDGDGAVNFADLGIMKAFFFGPPGPSGTAQGSDDRT